MQPSFNMHPIRYIVYFSEFLFVLETASAQPTILDNNQCRSTDFDDGEHEPTSSSSLEKYNAKLLKSLREEQQRVKDLRHEITTNQQTQTLRENEERRLIARLHDAEQNNTHLVASLYAERQLVQDLRRNFSVIMDRQLLKAKVKTTKAFSWPPYISGFAKVNDSFYILSEYSGGPNSHVINIYADQGNFTRQRSITITQFEDSEDMTYCSVSNRFYVTEKTTRWVWKMQFNNPIMTRWLEGSSSPHTVSVSTDGHVLLLNNTDSYTYLNVFRPDAVLNISIRLPSTVTGGSHAVQTQSGTYFVIHWLSGKYMHALSEVSAEGEIIKQFPSKESSFRFDNPAHLALDPVENRIFVADMNSNRVILISDDFHWYKVLLDAQKHGIMTPTRLHYNSRDGQLIVGQWGHGATVYDVI